jgi:hypothetical protein
LRSRLSRVALALGLAGAIVTGTGVEWALAFQAEGGGSPLSGNAALTVGTQEYNRQSIYPPEGPASGPEVVSRKVTGVLRYSRPGLFLALFDGQVDNRPHAEDAYDTRVNQLFGVYDAFESWKIRVGKQRTLWGHGFAYIPTDFINPPLDPTGLDLAKEGVEAVSVDYFTSLYSVTGIVARGDDLDVEGAGFKVTSSAISGLDLNAVYYHSDIVGHASGVSFAADSSSIPWAPWPGVILTGSAAVHQKSRYPEVVDREVGPPGGTVTFPGVGRAGEDGPYYSFLAGLSYEVLSWRLSTTAEYYYIGDAYSERDFGKVVDALKDSGTPRSQLASPWLDHLAPGRNLRQYLNLSLGQRSITDGANRFSDTFGYDVGLLWGLEDSSGLVSFGVKSRYWNRAELWLRTFVPAGRSDTEFGTMPFDWYVETGLRIGF